MISVKEIVRDPFAWILYVFGFGMVLCSVFSRVVVQFCPLNSFVYEGYLIWIWPFNWIYIDDLTHISASASYINQITMSITMYFMFIMVSTLIRLNYIAKRAWLSKPFPESRIDRIALCIGSIIFLTTSFTYRFGSIDRHQMSPSIEYPPELFILVIEICMTLPVSYATTLLRYFMPRRFLKGTYVSVTRKDVAGG